MCMRRFGSCLRVSINMQMPERWLMGAVIDCGHVFCDARYGERDQALSGLFILIGFAQWINPRWYRVGGQPGLEINQTCEVELRQV